MTNPAYGPSFFQARRTDLVHQHSHLHNRKSSLAHARSHADFHNRRDETADLDPRGATYTEVVQTIAVVQIIDGAGATLSAQTLPGTSQTDLIDAETGATLAVNHRDIVPTTGDVDATTASVVSAISSADPVSATETSVLPSETTTPDALSLTHISTSTSLPSSFSTLSSSNSTTCKCAWVCKAGQHFKLTFSSVHFFIIYFVVFYFVTCITDRFYQFFNLQHRFCKFHGIISVFLLFISLSSDNVCQLNDQLDFEHPDEFHFIRRVINHRMAITD